LTGLILAADAKPGDELKSLDGKTRGAYFGRLLAHALGKFIALAFVRYDYLAESTKVKSME
jgi:glycine cleavage system aminomethyltransferase T